jgi:Protein of unknown function (DUF4236)
MTGFVDASCTRTFYPPRRNHAGRHASGRKPRTQSDYGKLLRRTGPSGLGPNLRGISSFCAVAPQYPEKYADNPNMGFRFRRSIRLFPGLRLNVGKRGISASIGVRCAHVTYGPTGTRTTVGLPGSGLSYTHLEKPHHAVPIPTTAEPPTDPGAPQGSALRGVLWMGLIVIAIIVAIGHTTSPVPAQVSTPPQAVAQTAARAARAAEDEKLAETKSAVLGVTQIRHAVANSNTLRLARVTVMPTGAICYQLHLQNSRGVTYVRNAVMDGTVLSTSGSNGFTALWIRLCAQQSGGRDITADAKNVYEHQNPR